MSSDTWNQLQAHKRKQESLKERLLKRRKERQQGLGDLAGVLGSESPSTSSVQGQSNEGKTFGVFKWPWKSKQLFWKLELYEDLCVCVKP